MLQGVPMMGRNARIQLGGLNFHGSSYEFDESTEEDDITSFEDHGAYHPEATVYMATFSFGLYVDYVVVDSMYVFFTPQSILEDLFVILDRGDPAVGFGFQYALVRRCTTGAGTRSAARLNVSGVAIGPYDGPLRFDGSNYWPSQPFNPTLSPGDF